MRLFIFSEQARLELAGARVASRCCSHSISTADKATLEKNLGRYVALTLSKDSRSRRDLNRLLV